MATLTQVRETTRFLETGSRSGKLAAEAAQGASGTQPSRGIRPNVGLMPATPHSAAGMRMDRPVSLASAAGMTLAATATADPPLDPPLMKSGCHGLRVPAPLGCSVVMPQPNSCDLVKPTMTAPARLRRLITSASAEATAPARACEP
jgi:hypothetical protein